MNNNGLKTLARRSLITWVGIGSVVAGILMSSSRPEIDELALKGAQQAQFQDLNGKWQQISN